MKNIITMILVFMIGVADATVIFVDSCANGENTGAGWVNAYVNLQDALKHSGKGDTVLIAQGTYYPAQRDGRRDISFAVPTGLTVFGGYKSGGQKRDSKIFKTILNGDISRDDVKNGDSLKNIENNVYHVIVSEGIESVYLDGLTITGGYSAGLDANGMKVKGYGGGLYIHIWNSKNTSGLIMNNCAIDGNRAGGNGAGLYFKGSICELHGCNFKDNRTDISGKVVSQCGGGAFIESYCASIDSVILEKNEAAYGGGLAYKGKNITVKNTRLLSNKALWGGGALWFSGEDLKAENIVCEANCSSGGKGGVLFFRGLTMLISGMDARKNSASGIGGVIDFEGDSAVIKNAKLSYNTSGGSGGVIRFLGTDLVVQHSTFDNNSAQRISGGAILFEGKNCTFGKCKFNSNSSSASGGAVIFRGKMLVCDTSSFTTNRSNNANGGAIDFQGDSCSINASRFTDNSALNGSGGAINLTGKVFQIRNVIFKVNSAQNGGAVFCDHDIGSKPGNSGYYSGLCIDKTHFLDNTASVCGGAISWMGCGIIDETEFKNNAAQNGGALYGWTNAIGSKILFRNDSLVVDSSRVLAEKKASGNAIISKSEFSCGSVSEGAIASRWIGKFDSCTFGFAKIYKSKLIKLQDNGPVFNKPSFSTTSLVSSGKNNMHDLDENQIISRNSKSE